MKHLICILFAAMISIILLHKHKGLQKKFDNNSWEDIKIKPLKLLL